jgi:hypothetical protein
MTREEQLRFWDERTRELLALQQEVIARKKASRGKICLSSIHDPDAADKSKGAPIGLRPESRHHQSVPVFGKS